MEGRARVACRGTLLDWAGAIEAVAYELARRNGESPLIGELSCARAPWS